MTFLFNNKITIIPDLNSGSTDAFGRQRISSPGTLFSDRGMFNNNIYWSEDIIGAGALVDVTNSINASELLLTVGTALGDHVFRQTRQRMIYQPGKSQLIMLSGVMSPKPNVRHRLGYFSENDGVYFEHNGTTMNTVLRTSTSGSVVNNIITQSSWNIDKMDGTGGSGITLDWTKAQIYVVDLEWLGVGRVRVGVVVDGAIIYVHEFNHANVVTGTYMGHASLPLRYEIENTGVSTSATIFKQICGAVMSEGGHQESGLIFSADTNGVSLQIQPTTITPIISLRINPSNLHSSVALLSAQVLSTTNGYINYKLYFNATLSGAIWANQGQLVQIDTTATTISGGKLILSGYAQKKSVATLDSAISKLNLGFDINNIPDTITLAGVAIGNEATSYGSLTWNEKY